MCSKDLLDSLIKEHCSIRSFRMEKIKTGMLQGLVFDKTETDQVEKLEC